MIAFLAGYCICDGYLSKAVCWDAGVHDWNFTPMPWVLLYRMVVNFQSAFILTGDYIIRWKNQRHRAACLGKQKGFERFTPQAMNLVCQYISISCLETLTLRWTSAKTMMLFQLSSPLLSKKTCGRLPTERIPHEAKKIPSEHIPPRKFLPPGNSLPEIPL